MLPLRIQEKKMHPLLLSKRNTSFLTDRIYDDYASFAFASSASDAKPSASFTASSASILRFM